MEESERKEAQTFIAYLRKHRTDQLTIYIFGIIATSSAWLCGSYGLSYTWVFALLTVFLLIWRTKSLRLEDEYHQQEILMHRKRALFQGESAEWVNFIVNRWWVFSSASLFDIIKSHLDSALNGDSKPVFIDQLEVRSFTLGNQTPHIKNVRMFESSNGATEQTAWLDINNPPEGLKVALSHKIVMEADIAVCEEGFQMIFQARLGGKRMGVNCEAAVEKLSLRGKLQMIIHLSMDVPFPHIAKLTIFFVERPEVWFSIRILKAVQVMEVPLLKTWLHTLVSEALTDVLVDPNNIDVQLCQPSTATSAQSESSAVGVITVVLSGGQVCRSSSSVFNLPDAIHYCVVQLGDQKKYTVNVKGEAAWQSMLSFLVHNPKSDKILIKLKCRKLLHSSTMTQFEVPLKHYKLEKQSEFKVSLDKKTLSELKGDVKLDLNMTFTSLTMVDLESPLTELGEEEKECTAGVLYICVHGGEGLTYKLKNTVNAYCVVVVNRRRVKTSQTEPLNKNPNWDCFAEFFVADYSKSPVSVLIYDQNKKTEMEEELLGCAVVTLKEKEIRKVREKIQLKASSHCNSPDAPGFITISMLFRPVPSVAHSESSDCHHVYYTDNNVTTKRRYNSTSALLHMNAHRRVLQEFTLSHSLRYGLVELHLIQAKNLMAMDINGSSDPFVEIKVNGVRTFKSKVKKNTLNPVWNESVTLQLPKDDEFMDIIVWDKDPFGQDFLGSVTFTAEELKQHGAKAKPDWYTLHSVKHGQIQLEVKPSIVEDEQAAVSQEAMPRPPSSQSEPQVMTCFSHNGSEPYADSLITTQISEENNDVFHAENIQEDGSAETKLSAKSEHEPVSFNLDDCSYEQLPVATPSPVEGNLSQNFSTIPSNRSPSSNTTATTSTATTGSVSQAIGDSTTKYSHRQKTKALSHRETDLHTNCPHFPTDAHHVAQAPISNVYKRENGSMFTVAKQLLKQREAEKQKEVVKAHNNVDPITPSDVGSGIANKPTTDSGKTDLCDRSTQPPVGTSLASDKPKPANSTSMPARTGEENVKPQSANSSNISARTGDQTHEKHNVVYRTRSKSPSRDESRFEIEKKRLSHNFSLPPIPGSPLVTKAMSSDNFNHKHPAELSLTQTDKKGWFSHFRPSSIRRSWKIRKAVSEVDVHKPALSPNRARKAAAPSNMYRGVQGKVLGARGLTVHQGDIYCKVRLDRYSPYKTQKQTRGKEIAKSPVVRACAEPDFHLEFDLDEGQGIHENSVLIFDVKNVRKEHIGQRGVSLKHLLKDSQEVTKWLSLEGSIELQVQVSIGNASQSGVHTLPRKSAFKFLKS